MIITLENDSLIVRIKQKGAELCNVYRKDSKLEYMWRGDPAVWGKTSPVLFPVIGTLKENFFTYKNKKYNLSRHGFARDRNFEIIDQKNDKAVFVLKSDHDSMISFPFDFELQIIYELQQDQLQVTYHVINTGLDELYFSIGGHPAFGVPIVSGTTYEDHYLEFNKTENAGRWPINDNGLIENEPANLLVHTNRLDLKKSLFEKDALVLKHLNSTMVSLKSKTHSHGFDFHFDGFPFLGIWAAKNADFLCIEPWCGITDSVMHDQNLATKEGIENLQADKSWARTWKVKFY